MPREEWLNLSLFGALGFEFSLNSNSGPMGSAGISEILKVVAFCFLMKCFCLSSRV